MSGSREQMSKKTMDTDGVGGASCTGAISLVTSESVVPSAMTASTSATATSSDETRNPDAPGLDFNDYEEVMGCYLLHFEPAFKHARHYLGWSNNIARRVEEHLSQTNKSSPLVRAAIDNGSVVTLTRVWFGAERDTEKKLKLSHRRRFCPVCAHADGKPVR